LRDGSEECVLGSHDEGYAVVLIAYGKVAGGGIADTAVEPHEEDETHVIVDRCATGDQNG